MSDLVDDLMSFTGLGREEAATLLEASNFDLAAAATLHFEQQDGRIASARAAASEAEWNSEDSSGMHEVAEGEAEARADRIEAAAAAARPPPRAAAEGESGYFDRYPRIRYCLALLWRTPGMSLVHSLVLGLGRLFFNIGRAGVSSLLLAPLQMLGLVSWREEVPAGAPAAQLLETQLEAEYGSTHPSFFRGSCQQALSRSRQQAKFLLACLYSPGSDAAEQFSRRVLSSALFTAFVDENFLFWAGDVRHPDGRAVRHALRPRELPALFVLAHGDMAAAMNNNIGVWGDDAPAQALAIIQGIATTDEERVIAQLSAVLEVRERFKPLQPQPSATCLRYCSQRFEPMLVAARAEQHERAFERQLREQQEEEYARALAVDQAREAAEAEEVERQEREAQARQEELERAQQQQLEEELAETRRREARRAKADTLPAEPAASSDVTQVVVRMPDGQRLTRRFGRECNLQAVVDFIESADPDIYEGSDFDLVSNYPRQVFTRASRTKTLDELGLHPATTLFTLEQDE